MTTFVPMLRPMAHLLALEEKGQGSSGQVSRPAESVCAWCAQERGEKPNPDMQQSHTICARHLAAIKADLEQRHEAAAAS